MAESLQDNIQNTAATIKLPPNSQEAEQSVLGGLMLNDQHWFDLVDILQPSDFYRNQHQLIYQAMIELANQDEALDAVTVSEKLKSKAILEKAGGIEYLGQLAESSTGASNVLAYARIIRERSVLRQLVVLLTRLTRHSQQKERIAKLFWRRLNKRFLVFQRERAQQKVQWELTHYWQKRLNE